MMRESAIATRLRAGSNRLGLLPVVALALAGVVVLKVAQLAFGELAPSTISPATAQEAAKPEGASDAKGADLAMPSDEKAPGAASGGNGTAASDQDASDEPGSPEMAAEAAGSKQIAERPAVVAGGGDGAAPRFMTQSEIEVLNRLTQRRKELERRGKDLEMRGTLLKAAEKRVEEKLAELKRIEARIESRFERQEDAKNAQFKNLVAMYETMKPKEAARIFETLDMDVLLSVVEQMNARKMAPVLARMNPEAAQRLTIELAARASGEDAARTQTLPVIADREPG